MFVNLIGPVVLVPFWTRATYRLLPGLGLRILGTQLPWSTCFWSKCRLSSVVILHVNIFIKWDYIPGTSEGARCFDPLTLSREESVAFVADRTDQRCAGGETGSHHRLVVEHVSELGSAAPPSRRGTGGGVASELAGVDASSAPQSAEATEHEA